MPLKNLQTTTTSPLSHSHSKRSLAWLGLLTMVALLPACQAEKQNDFALQNGDLLFQDSGGGALGRAIKAVTEGCEGAKFTHVGIVVIQPDGPAVVESSKGGVHITPLPAFLARATDAQGRPRVVVGRLKAAYRPLAAPAVERARAMLGTPYDDEFLLNNGKLYCSELVYEAYRDNAGRPLFQVSPMTFRPPGSQATDPAWQEYFDAKHLAVPEGKPGCNPGGLSRSEVLDIVYAFGLPEGWPEAAYRHRSKP